MSRSACRGCGGENPVDDAFCGHCGLRAAALEVASEVSAEAWSCRDCGAGNRPATAYCGACGARWGGTRVEDLRLVTALFADISGFTTLADTLETEDLHDVINPLIGGLARIAEKYNGFITKYAGDALLVIYGAPVAHEDDAQRALLTALEMHATLPSLLEHIGPAAAHLTIHVGVNTGKVVAGRVGSDAQADYSVLGDSVILAQRLESVCPSGQTYVGPSTYELCKGEFDFESVGELTLKGKLKPVEGHRLVGRRRAGTTTERPLVGRSAELAVVDEVLDAVESGRGVLLSVSGEPGNGKSRLLAEARTRATGRGVRWLPARCLSYGSALPYWPFADLLRQALALRVEDPPEQIQARLWDVMPRSTIVGAERLLGLPVDPVGPEQARREVHDALAAWLRMLAERSPVVLSIEDTHWADAATMDVLGELIRTTGDLGVGLVLTCRPEGLEAVEALASDTESRALPVGPLSDTAVTELAGDVLGQPAGPELMTLLVERTRGNPLFVEELCRSLQESGALVDTSAGSDLRPGYDLASVPGTVERVFNARVDALPTHALALLSTCAVIGRISRLSLIRAVVEDDPRSTLDLLAELGMLDTVVDSDEPSLAFHHALLHDVVYSRILRKQKRALHRRVADVGRQLYGDSDITVELLARHLYLADAGLEAVDPLLRAGRRANALYAVDGAAVHFERAVEVLEQVGTPLQVAEAVIELAAIRELQGDYETALALYERGRHGADPARAWTGTLSVLRRKGDVELAQAAFLQALSVVGSSSPVSVPLWLESGWALTTLGRARDAVPVLYTGLKLAPADDHAVRGQIHVQLARAELMSGRPDQCARAVTAAISEAEASRDLRLETAALRVLGQLEHSRGDLAAAHAATSRALQLADRTGTVEELAGLSLNLAFITSSQGDPSSAVELVHQAVGHFERIDHGAGRAIAYGNLASLLVELGRYDESLGWADRALAQASRTGHLSTLAEASEDQGRALLALGRRNEGEAALRVSREHFLATEDEEGAARCDALLAELSEAQPQNC
ncbi:MAG: adenylate/guanylate cyclase domain-containing protein [Mycobacteriales bacterium]|nr:adenylate/guanylate cyclase domain-containing protein [Mycobacteriales bacterium]